MTKELDDALKKEPDLKVKFFMTASGNTTAAMMPHVNRMQEATPNPFERWGSAKTLVVGICMGDSYEGHKAFWREHHEDLLKKKGLPYRILGGLTPDLAPLDREDNKMFKNQSKDHLQRLQVAKCAEDPKAVPRAMCMHILARFVTKNCHTE